MEFERVQLILKNNGNCLFCQSPAPGLIHSLTPLLHSLKVNNVKDEGQHVEVDLECFEIKTGLCNDCGNLNQTFLDLKQKMEECLATVKAKVKVGSEKNDGGIKYPSLEEAIMKQTLHRLNRDEPRVILKDLPLSERFTLYEGMNEFIIFDELGKMPDPVSDPSVLEEKAPSTSKAKRRKPKTELLKAPKKNFKPRYRMTAYACFIQTCEENLKKRYPNVELGYAEFSRQCADHWRAMNDEGKARFIQMAENDKKRYNQEMETYPPKRRGKKRKRKDPNAPKRPLSAFFWFSYDERAKVREAHPWFSVTDLAREMGMMWKVVDPVTRNKYETMSQKDKARYDKEMTAYKARGKEEPVSNGNGEVEYDVVKVQDEVEYEVVKVEVEEA